jgi:ABC-type dipeptide/oligopeptide/nickel transport system permease subunit
MAAVEASASKAAEGAAYMPERKGLLQRLGTFRRQHGLAFAGAVFFILVVLGAIFAPVLTPYEPNAYVIEARLQTPNLAHPFGTDEFGRDLFTRVLYGARPVLISGVLSVLVAMVIGTAIGTISAYWGGRVDQTLMRLMDVMLSFPAILLAILIVATLGSGLLNITVAIAFSMIPTFARLVRSIVLTLMHQEYVAASHAVGGTNLHIIRHHVFPNMIPPIIVQATAMLAIAISYESAFGFLGLGVEPPTPDWGLMVNEGQRLIFDAPHVPFFPGLAITLTVMSVNFIGDALRDMLDPKLKNR